MEGNAIKLVKERVRELHCVVMDPEHVARACCVRSGGQIISRTVKCEGGITAFQSAFQRTSHPRAMLST